MTIHMYNKLPHNTLLALALLLAGFACPLAQARAQTAGVDPVQYIVAPETPGPYAPVTITVRGVGAFLGDAAVSWSVDGGAQQSGTGLSTFSFTTGGLGTQSIVRLTIDSQTQGVISHTFVFTPSTINLVWEADTSVPPLFAGKALYSAGSALRIIAFPTVIVSGRKVAAESLSYQWSVNDTPVPSASGTGKYSLSYSGDQLQVGESVAVDVYFGTLKVGHAELSIPASQPQLLLYNKDALRGVVWDTALPAQIALNAREITVQAQPYFFSNGSIRSGAFSWAWSLGGSAITGPDSDRGLLTLRQTGDGQGSTNLGVALQNQDAAQLVQSAQAALSIVFGQAKSGLSSFFGL